MEPENALRRTVDRLTRRRLIGTVATASALATVGVTPARTAFAAQEGEQVAPTEGLDTQTPASFSDQTSAIESHRPGFYDDLGQTSAANPSIGAPRPDGQLDHQAPRQNDPQSVKGCTDA